MNDNTKLVKKMFTDIVTNHLQSVKWEHNQRESSIYLSKYVEFKSSGE